MKKVITYGTYDLFHQGHYNILKRAREYGDYLIVAVTGENYDIGRGKLSVHDTLAERIENVKKTGLADQIIVEEYLGQKISDIIRYDVDTFVIGDDWKGKFDHLNRYCNMVYLERTQGISSTQIRQEIFRQYNIGIITDIPDDNCIITECEEINGFDVGGIYTESAKVRDFFREKYGLETSYTDAKALVESSDIVYIHCALKDRARYIRLAAAGHKHIICDPPFSIDREEHEELLALAGKSEVILMDNIKMVHVYVFNQLLWVTQGGLIGELVSMNCSISRNDRRRGNLFYDLLALALCPTLKIMGMDYDKIEMRTTVDGDSIEFGSLIFEYPKATAVINVGNKVRVKDQLEIIGTKGTVRSNGRWWAGDHFELDKTDVDSVDIYNTNISGNGFKYLLKGLSTMLDNGRLDSMGIFADESIRMAEIFDAVRTFSGNALR